MISDKKRMQIPKRAIDVPAKFRQIETIKQLRKNVIEEARRMSCRHYAGFGGFAYRVDIDGFDNNVKSGDLETCLNYTDSWINENPEHASFMSLEIHPGNARDFSSHDFYEAAGRHISYKTRTVEGWDLEGEPLYPDFEKLADMLATYHLARTDLVVSGVKRLLER
jgi:hypothetical protein